jgi:hypothetical protein
LVIIHISHDARSPQHKIAYLFYEYHAIKEGKMRGVLGSTTSRLERKFIRDNSTKSSVRGNEFLCQLRDDRFTKASNRFKQEIQLIFFTNYVQQTTADVAYANYVFMQPNL